jgi:uncharacterized HAD superfamily protein
MKIAIDLDEVLNNDIDQVIAYHNNLYHTELKREDFFSYNFWEVWGGSKAEAVEKILAFYKTDFFKNIKPVPEAIELMKSLKERGDELYVVTGRPDEIVSETKDWIERYFPNMFTDIYNTNHFSLINQPKTKSEICNMLSIKAIIDDNKDHALDCAEAGIKVFLLDCPWNKEVSHSNITRVYNLSEIQTLI